MVNDFEFRRDKLYLCADKFFSDSHHCASAFFADLLSVIDRMQHFAVRNAFDQFLTLACIFLFTEMFLNFNQVRFLRIGICTGFHFIKKRHLSLDLKCRCLLGFCSIKFTGQEINLLFQEQDLLFQMFDMLLILLLGAGHGRKLLPLRWFHYTTEMPVFPVFIRNFADYCMQEETIFEQLSAVRDSILPAASGAAAVISAGLLHQSWAIEDVRSQNACIKDRIRLLHSGLL